MKHRLWLVLWLASSAFGQTLSVSTSSISVTIAQACSGTTADPVCTYTPTVAPTSITVSSSVKSIPFEAITGTVGATTAQQAPWLLVSGKSSVTGTTSASIALSVSPSALPPGSYEVNGYVTIYATVAGVQNSPQLVLVSADVSCTGTGCPAITPRRDIFAPPPNPQPQVQSPSLSLSSEGLVFASTTPASQTLTVNNPPGAASSCVAPNPCFSTFQVTPSPAENWLTIMPSTITETPATVTIAVNPLVSGISPGNPYSAHSCPKQPELSKK